MIIKSDPKNHKAVCWVVMINCKSNFAGFGVKSRAIWLKNHIWVSLHEISQIFLNCIVIKRWKVVPKLTLSHTLFPSLPLLSLIPLSPLSLSSDTSTLPTTPFLVTVKDWRSESYISVFLFTFGHLKTWVFEKLAVQRSSFLCSKIQITVGIIFLRAGIIKARESDPKIVLISLAVLE